MVQTQFSLSWESFNSSICKGFSSLQQNGEFVDMTLAADGHYVKVHQVLMALASPYLKELISSAPCQHPVLFLNNVSHRTLSLLLMYIYTGEVHIPADSLRAFAEAAKALHIKGLENITGNEGMTVKVAENVSQLEDGEFCHVSGIKRMGVPVNEEVTEQIELPAAARKILIKKEPYSLSALKHEKASTQLRVSSENKDDTTELLDFTDTMDDHVTHDSDEDYTPDGSLQKSSVKSIVNQDGTEIRSSNLQFTVSIRGSLQIILNRYIYNLHSSTLKSGVKRWRCVDYRNHKCMAFVVTKGNVVLNRANLHNHSFHDKKIIAKIEKKSVYSALDEVAGYKEREAKVTETDTSMENEDYAMMLDDFGSGINDTTEKVDPKIN